MKEKWETFKMSLTDETSMSKKEFLLTIAVCILGGIVFGLLFSPRKNTVIASNNGNNNRDMGEKDEIADWSSIEEREEKK